MKAERPFSGTSRSSSAFSAGGARKAFIPRRPAVRLSGSACVLGHAGRIGRTHLRAEDLFEVGEVPARFEASGFDAHLRGLLPSEQAEGQVPQGSEVLRR